MGRISYPRRTIFYFTPEKFSAQIDAYDLMAINHLKTILSACQLKQLLLTKLFAEIVSIFNELCMFSLHLIGVKFDYVIRSE